MTIPLPLASLICYLIERFFALISNLVQQQKKGPLSLLLRLQNVLVNYGQYRVYKQSFQIQRLSVLWQLYVRQSLVFWV